MLESSVLFILQSFVIRHILTQFLEPHIDSLISYHSHICNSISVVMWSPKAYKLAVVFIGYLAWLFWPPFYVHFDLYNFGWMLRVKWLILSILFGRPMVQIFAWRVVILIILSLSGKCKDNKYLMIIFFHIISKSVFSNNTIGIIYNHKNWKCFRYTNNNNL